MMKEKKIYINRYHFYGFNCWLILWTVIYLTASALFIPIFVLTPVGASIGIIGGADGPTAIYVTSKFAFLPFLIALIGVIAIWIMLFINYKKDKDAVKSVSLKRAIICAFLSILLLIITEDWVLSSWPLSLGVVLIALWRSSKFEACGSSE